MGMLSWLTRTGPCGSASEVEYGRRWYPGVSGPWRLTEGWRLADGEVIGAVDDEFWFELIGIELACDDSLTLGLRIQDSGEDRRLRFPGAVNISIDGDFGLAHEPDAPWELCAVLTTEGSCARSDGRLVYDLENPAGEIRFAAFPGNWL